MNDQAVPLASAVAATHTAGALLRQAREAAGLHVAALAVAMKVPVKKLEALEADRLEELPDAVFVRALAASVCRTLKIDPAPVLQRLPQSVAPKLAHTDSGVSMPTQGAQFLAGQSVGAFASRPAVLWVAGLLLAALAVAYFPEARNGVRLAESVKSGAAADLPAGASPGVSPALSAPAMPVVRASVPVPAVAPASATVPVLAATAAPAAPAASAASMPAAKPALAAVAAAPEAAPAAASLLLFKASARAWLRVSDSKGAVQLEKTLSAGESATVSAAVPLSVVLGNAAATEVVLRGQPFSLEGLAQNNVARFEVK